MGDRVAVMRKGELQQVGAPQELYDRPVNLFVGGFIGSPAMNLVEAKLERADGGFAAAAGSQRIALGEETLSARPGLKDYEGRDVILGIRPEDLEDAELEPDREQTLEGEVELTEALGSEIMVHFSIDAPPAITDEVRELQEDAGTDDGLGSPTSGGRRPHDHGRPLRRPLEGDQGRAGARSPSTRALCISSIRTQVSVSTTEPKEREHEDDEATLHSARAARRRTCVSRRRLRRRRRRGRGHGGATTEEGAGEAVSGNISVLAVWTGAEGEAFQAVLDGFTAENPDVKVSYKSAAEPATVLSTVGRGRQPARHRRAAAAGLHDRLRAARRAEADRLRGGQDQGGLLAVVARPRHGRREALRPLLQGRQQVDHLVQRPRFRGRRRRARGRTGTTSSRPATRSRRPASRPTRSAAPTAGPSPTCSRTSTSARQVRRSTTS